MPTRVLLEGPAIEPLLAQVREEYGSSVRIISADKVRSGGLGGFFAKQRYELSVEVPDEADEPPKRPGQLAASSDEPPQTLEQLLARVESNDHVGGPARTEIGVGIDAPRQPGRTIDASVTDPLSRGSREAGMTDAEAAADGLPPRSGLLSAESSAFADLMAGLDGANAAAAAARDAKDDDDPGKPTVRPFRPSTAQGSPINGAAIKSLPPVPSLAELMGGLGLDDLIPPEDAPQTAGNGAAPDPRTSRLQRSYGLSSPVSGPPAAAAPASAPPAPARVAPARPSPAPAAPAPAEPFAMPRSSDPVVANLVKVGMPPAMAASIVGADTYAGVLTALASRPVAPALPDAPGEILVLAGELAHALPIGRQIVEQLGLEQAHLLLAEPSAAGTGTDSSRVISGPEEAQQRAQEMQSAEAAWVVVLDAPVGATDSTWARQTCEALGATAVWAVVDATRKTADTARHLSLLGDVEALVVHGTDVTSDPATVLGLELPIVSLDGKPATPHAWAAMLCARIAVDVAPVAVPARRTSRGR